MAYQRKTYDLFISDELKEVLEQIKSESVVADLILKHRLSKDDLVDDPVNFISISSQDPTRISYLTTERIGMINPDEYWTSSRRFHMKPGGFIAKIFKDISAKDVEVFSNLYRAEVRKPKFEFQIVNGEDIRKYYHYDVHTSDSGSLGVSCMRYDRCQKLFDLYVDNTDKISLLLMLNENGHVLGRCLLWKFNEYKIMDRIYSVNDEQLPFYFKKWSTENGYLYRSQQNWYNSLQFENLNKSKQFLKLDIELENFDFRYYPYMDTFKFFSPKSGTFSNHLPKGVEHYTLCSTEGDKYGYDYLIYDDIDKYYRHRGETVRLDYLDLNTHPDKCYYSEMMDCYILKENAEWREDIQDYIYRGDYSELNDNERIESRIKRMSESSSSRFDLHKEYMNILNQITHETNGSNDYVL